MIETAQRRCAPNLIGMDWNADRHQFGITDRLRWNTHSSAISWPIIAPPFVRSRKLLKMVSL
jgi:hypothetical protein